MDTFEIFMATDGEPEEIEGLFCEFIRDSLVGEAAFLFRYYEQLLPDVLTGKLKFFGCLIPEQTGDVDSAADE